MVRFTFLLVDSTVDGALTIFAHLHTKKLKTILYNYKSDVATLVKCAKLEEGDRVSKKCLFNSERSKQQSIQIHLCQN